MGIHDLLIAEMDMVSAGILGLAFIILIVFSVLAAKNWHWVNIVFLVLCYITGATAIYGMTIVYKERADQMKAVEREEQRAIKAEADLNEVVYGPSNSLEYDPGSLRATSEELARQMAGRGRVWSGGQIASEGNMRTFTFASPREANAPSLQNVVLFAFLESPVAQAVYPSRFIGTVRVTEESPQSVKVEAVALADPTQFAQPSGTWSLFEKMPLDRRGLFKDAVRALVNANPNPSAEDLAFVKNLDANFHAFKPADSTIPFDISRFRNILMAEPFLPAQRLGFDPASAEYEALIDRYAFDGLPLGVIQNWIDQNSAGRKKLRFEPSREEVFVKYKFKKKSSKSYQVDANGSLENDGLFTPLGQAIATSLHAGKEIEFAVDDEVLVDQVTVEGYTRGENQVPRFDQGEDVEVVDRIYLRQVRDFPFEFGDLTTQSGKLVSEIARITKANAVQQKSLDDANNQINERSALTTKLDADNKRLETDQQTIAALAQQRTNEIAAYKQKIAQLENEIAQTYKQIREMAVKISKRAFANR